MQGLLKYRILVALVVLLVVAGVRFGSRAFRGRTPQTAGEVSGEPAPSSENVSHAFRVRVEELRGRLDAEPADTLALGQLADLLFDAHRLEEAAGLYERYLAIEPHARQVWLDLAAARADLGLLADAEGTLARMLEEYPDDPAATWNLGALAANQGRMEEAAEWWHRTAASSDSTLSRMAREALSRLLAS